MSHITELSLENYRSFRQARCRLSPFTLIVGANNAGKSNLLRAVRDALVSDAYPDRLDEVRHHRSGQADVRVAIKWSDDSELNVVAPHRGVATFTGSDSRLVVKSGAGVPVIYRLDPNVIGGAEKRVKRPFVAVNGEGVSAVLDRLNSGSSTVRKRYEEIVAALRRCVPEITHIGFENVDDENREIYVEQTGLPEPRPLGEVSDGTRLILAILTLVNMEGSPPLLLLEDINQGLHPRLYERLVEFLRAIAAQGRTQILATTHDPYLIDEFRDTPEAVVIVEKKGGASTLSNLDERLKGIRAPGEELEMPLGELWFSGVVGGVPKMKLPEMLKVAEE